MLSLGAAPIYLYRQAVDMRRSFDGLSALVAAAFPGQLTVGAYFVFVNRRRTHVKLLYWDGDGLVQWYKRLERGCFRVPLAGSESLTRRDLLLLLEGITPRRLAPRYRLGEAVG